MRYMLYMVGLFVAGHWLAMGWSAALEINEFSFYACTIIATIAVILGVVDFVTGDATKEG